MNWLRRFRNDKSANVGVLFAISVTPILGVTGAAVDYMRASNARVELQAAVDAAAIAGVIADAPNDAARITLAQNYLTANVANPDIVTLPLEDESLETSVGLNRGIMTVRASGTIETVMIKVLGVDAIPITVTSQAVKDRNSMPVCVLALNKAASKAINFAGNSTFIANKCFVQSNSAAADALSIAGSAVAKAAGFCAVGGYSAPSSQTPMPQRDCLSVDDPYANTAPPVPASCNGSNTNVAVQPNKTRTLQPGTYCGGLDLKGNVTLQPGLYIIKDGNLSINSQATVTGDGVTFYIMGTNAGFTINGGGSINVTAMSSGDYKGLVIVHDRASNVGSTNTLNGNSGTVIKGVVYTPTQQLTLTGTGTFGQTSPFMPIIADQIKISGNAGASSDVTAMDTVKPVPFVPTGARLIF